MAELLGRIDVELLARQVDDFLPQRIDFPLRHAAHFGKRDAIERGADALHARERRDERRVDVGVACKASVLVQRLAQGLAQHARDRCVSGCGRLGRGGFGQGRSEIGVA